MRPCIILFGFLFAFMLTQVCTAAVADHVFWMEIEVLWHYGDPIEPSDTEYEFDIEIQTDAMVRRVEVLTPGGLTFEIPALPDQYNWETDTWTNYEYDSQEDVWIWEYEKTTVSLAELNVYGDGWYRVTVIYEVGFDQTMLWFGIPNTTQPLAQPTQQPVPIHPLPRQQATSPVTFQWQPCTDPAVRIIWAWTENEDTDEEIEADGPLDKNATQWGPVALESGFWEAGMSFINGYHPVLNDNTVNSDGIAYAVIKSTEVEYDFAVDRPWVAYQVWGGDVSYLQEPDWWEYYFRPGQYGYTLLGESDGSSEVFYGNYSMYVILARQPVHVDCIRGSDGSYYRGNYTTACVDNWNNISGPCDGSHATIGTPDCDGEGIFILTSISDWAWLRVVTDTGCPFADLSGDCFVGLADLAVLAEHWMTGRQ